MASRTDRLGPVLAVAVRPAPPDTAHGLFHPANRDLPPSDGPGTDPAAANRAAIGETRATQRDPSGEEEG
jgi:hypothetical protein